MFFSTGLSGSDLPPRTVCLTFDDGPGRDSLELASWLHRRGVQATFFVVGKYAVANKDALRQMADMGHLIANHTFTHRSLSLCYATLAAKEILDTDTAIADLIPAPFALFRPPYLDWSPGVAGMLNWSSACKCTGPVMTDIDGRDWQFWRDGSDAASCAAAYIQLIGQIGRGIIIMHDSSIDDVIRRNSQTLSMAQHVVVWLQEHGYRMVRLDAIPQIRDAAKVSSVIALQAANGCFLSPQQGGGGEVRADCSWVGPWEPLGVIELGDNKIALRCLSGHYLSAPQGGGGKILASGPAIGASEVLTREDLGNGAIALRCANGNYVSLQRGGGGEILANGSAIGAPEVFRALQPA